MAQKGVKWCLWRQYRPFRFLFREWSFVTNKAKSKVVQVFNYALRNKAVVGKGGIYPRILNFGIEER